MELPLPDNLDCERFVLGALLCADPARTPVEAILGNLNESDFAIEKHKRIYLRMGELVAAGHRVDRVSLANELDKRNQLQSVDGLSYLVSLDDGLPVLHDLDGYLAILREKAMLRRLILQLDEIQQRAQRSEPALDLVEDLRRIGEGLQPKGPAELSAPEEIVESVGINELVNPKLVVGIDPPTGWLRNYMRFEPKTLTVLAARTSAGKSAFALQAMHCAAHQGAKTAFYSLEMDKVEILRRLIGQVGRVNMHKLRIGYGNEEERAQASNAAWKICELNDSLLFCDKGSVTLPMIRQHLHRMKLERKPARFLIVDYLQLMSTVGKFGGRTEEVSSLSRGLKTIAQDFDIPVMALSQLSRKADEGDREPRLSDLRESGTIEQDANNVIFLHRRGNPDEEEQAFRLIIGKNRNGPLGRCDLTFVKRYARFDEADDRKASA